MDINEFLEKLVSDDYEVINLGFESHSKNFNDLVKNINSKLAVGISSSIFNENINLIPQDIIESIISLPIYNDFENLMLLVYNPHKFTNDCILIDESDSLIHKITGDVIEDGVAYELIDSITSQYSQHEEDEFLALKSFKKEESYKRKVMADYDESPTLHKLSGIDINEDYYLDDDEKDDFLELKEKTESSKKRRVIRNQIADDILNLKEEKSIQESMKMHDSISVDMDELNISGNFFSEMMHVKKRQNVENLLFKNNKKLIEDDVNFRKLGKIADLHNIDEKNAKNTLLIATCKGCSSKIVYYNHDVDDFDGEIYVEIDNLTEDILIDYLYEYLNSSNGMDDLFYYSKGNNYLRADNIRSLKVPIPSIETQMEIVKASREAREFFKTVELLKNEFNDNIFDYKHILESIRELKGDIEFDSTTSEITKLPRSWRHAYQGLIWPLAISYLRATKGGFESVEKKDNYLVLFEFIAAFNCIILLSGLPDDVYQQNFDKIWDAYDLKEYKSMTFANWFYVSKNLADIYKNSNFTSRLDENLFNKISSDKILDIIEKAKDLRNSEAHGSHSNSYEAEEIIEELDNYLEDIFDILEVYSNYKLIYVTGEFSGARNGYSHRVILLNGPCAQPIYDNIIFDEVLTSECLYLYNPKNNNKLLIKDNLMKFRPTDKNKKHWALFLYYSCDKGEYNAFYKCFQSNEKDIKESINSFKWDILS